MYEDEPLKDYYTLMDIAYIYTWRRVSSYMFLLSNLTVTLHIWSWSLEVSEIFKQVIYLSFYN